MTAAAPALIISVELTCVSFCEMRWSGGGLTEMIVVVTSGSPPPMPRLPPWGTAVSCSKSCVGDDAANSLIVWKVCFWLPVSK